ncbi:T9SS type A sorting domain-containing protein [Chryseobacterium sp.]|uniref:T9SS type A sorting domain-containing protein n=1 Tax=Chryseobacterium sp. TaxID=1871047 RepID=UPI0025BB3676|nr:T9SS type A sorting domain-containing protein [Chryseobacterium sp.]
MIRKLLFSIALASSFCAPAQVLESDNYNAYTIGNVGTDVTGTTAGQGGMYLYGGTAANFQIVDGGTGHANYLQVTTGNTAAAASNRYVFKSGLDTAWQNRTAGNNIVKGSVDIYTGTSTGVNVSGVALYGENTSGTEVILVGIRYNSSTKQINGLAYLTDGLTPGTYNISFNGAPSYPANTWITVGYSYNTTTGAITYTMNGTSTTLNIAGYTTPAGFSPTEHDVLSSYGTGNTAATTFGIDNYTVEASNNAVLAVSENGVLGKKEISIYPNPASDILNISSESKVNKVEIYDMSGKKVNAGLNGDQVNISNLAPGNYIINIETKDEKTSRRFIKK